MKRLVDIPLGIYEKAIPLSYSWEEKFSYAKEAGFDSIELSIDARMPRFERLTWPREKWVALRELAKKYDCAFQTMSCTVTRFYPLGEMDDTIRNQGMEYFKQALQVADALQVKVMQIPAYDVYQKESTDETKQRYVDALISLIPEIEKTSVIVAIEVLEDVPHMETIRQCVSVIEQINHPQIRLYADTGNVIYNGHNPEEDLSYDKGYIVACHLKDAVLHNEHNVPYGEGLVNFEACLKHFKDVGFDGYFVAECWHEIEQDYLPPIKQIHDFLVEKMESVDSNEEERL